MDELVVEVEDHLGEPRRIAEEFNLRLGLQVDVRLAEPLSLPRFEGKGRRFDRRPPTQPMRDARNDCMTPHTRRN